MEPAAAQQANDPDIHIVVQDLTMAYGDFVIQHDLNFSIRRGEIFIVMGGSGCGKTTLLHHMIGLKEPARGRVLYDRTSYWDSPPEVQLRIKRSFGMSFQSGALWSSLTLAENVALPLGEYTDLGPTDIAEVVSLKLALVGLAGFEDFYPSEISGGMHKRAALFFDEPSAGLDPISSRRLDELIMQLRDSLGTTIVVVTHELASIFTIGNDSVYLDTEARTMTASGDPRILRDESPDPGVRRFLNRGEI